MLVCLVLAFTKRLRISSGFSIGGRPLPQVRGPDGSSQNVEPAGSPAFCLKFME